VKRRVVRYLASILTMLSLLLCVGALGAWYVTADLPRERPGALPVGTTPRWEARSGRGTFFLSRIHLLPTKVVPVERQILDGTGSTQFGVPYCFLVTLIRIDDSRVQIPVVNNTWKSVRSRYRGWSVEGGWWFLVAVFAILPGKRAFRLIVRWRRRRHGLCEECAYDLRESPERCPECGTQVARRRAAISG
jgi:hypothetical protein